MEKEIIIKPTFDVKSTFKATLHFLVGSKNIFIIFLIIILFLIKSIWGNHSNYKEDILTSLLPIFVIIILFPILLFLIYRSAKTRVLENPRLKENIIYVLNNEYFQEKGDSFEVKHFWKNKIKIVEKNDLFLIFIAKNQAKFIKKSDLKENQYNELKELFGSLNIIKSLK